MNRTSSALVVLAALSLPVTSAASVSPMVRAAVPTSSRVGASTAVVRLTPRGVDVSVYDVTTDSRGHRVVVWGVYPGTSRRPGIGVREERRTGSWGPARYVEKGKRVWDPAITATSGGRLFLVYRKSIRSGRQSVIRYVTRGPHAARWSAPKTIRGSTFRYSSGFTLLPDAHNRVALVYAPDHIVSWTWSKGRWGEPQSLTQVDCDTFSVILTSAALVQGACTIADDQVQTFSRPMGGAWSLGPTLPLPQGAGGRVVVLTADPRGRTTAVMRGSHASLWTASEDSTGDWSAPTQIGRVENYGLWPGSVATDSRGDTMVVVRYAYHFDVYFRPAGGAWRLDPSHSQWYHGKRPMDDVNVLGSRTFIQAWGRAKGLHTRIRLSDGTWSHTTTRRTGGSFDVRVTPANANNYLLTWWGRSFALYSLAVQ